MTNYEEVECVFYDKYNQTGYRCYSKIPLESMVNVYKHLPNLKINKTDYINKLMKFKLKMKQMGEMVCDGIDGTITTSVLLKELENIFGYLDKILFQFKIINLYIPHVTHLEKEMKESIAMNMEKILKAYIKVFDIFDNSVTLNIQDIDLESSLILTFYKNFNKEKK